MRVQCGVCEKAEAVLICCADEAALCAACDVKVHAANKLASKHQRVSLSKPSGDHPRCDICQEKSAFFFCIEDRALLCRNCDLSIHSVNSLAANHRRFLVTGLRVGLNALVQDPVEAQSAADSGKSSGGAKVCGNPCTRQTPENSFTISVSTPVSKEDSDFGSQDKYVQAAVSENSEENYNLRFIPASKGNSEVHASGNRNQRSTSKVANTTEKNMISEFLTEGVPGWRVDEFFNMPEVSGGYSLADIVSSKGAMSEFDWAADLDLFEEQSVHQVPELQSAPLYTGASRPSKPNAVSKVKAKQDMAIISDFEDCFTVPDCYEDFGVPSASYKRRKVYYE